MKLVLLARYFQDGLVSLLLAFEVRRHRHVQMIRRALLFLLDCRRKGISGVRFLDHWIADIQYRRTRFCDPLTKLRPEISTRYAREDSLQIIKRRSLKFTLAIKCLKSTDKSLIPELLAEHMKYHQRFAVTHSLRGCAMTSMKFHDGKVPSFRDIISILLKNRSAGIPTCPSLLLY